MSKAQLNRKQRKFCLEYIKDFNRPRAIEAAGYKVKNADVTACNLLKKVSIKSYIEELLNHASNVIDENWIISELLSNYARVKEEKNEQYIEKYHTNLMKYKQLLTDKQVIESGDVADFLRDQLNKSPNKANTSDMSNEQSNGDTRAESDNLTEANNPVNNEHDTRS